MRRRHLLSLVLPVLLALVLAGCATGSGLRVEGVETPVTVTVSPSAEPSPSLATDANPKVGPTNAPKGQPAVDLQVIRRTLLADSGVDPNFRSVLAKCEVIDRCMRRGVAVDVMHVGRPQQVVTVHTVDGFTFGAFLLAQEPNGPRLVWSLKADQAKVSATKDGGLVVESQVFGQNDRACCPSGSKVEVYRWNGQQMTRTSEKYQEGD